MKKFLYACGVLVLVVFCLIAPNMRIRTAPAIAVWLQDETGGGTDYLPAVNGYVSGRGSANSYSDGKDIYNANYTFKVVSTGNGQFAVLSHYVVERNGVLTTVDRALPVFAERPDKTKWAKVDDHLIACACLSDTTIRY